MSKKMKIIFTLSVILNVLLIGWAAGEAVHKFRKHDPVQKIARDMSPEGRHIVAKTMQSAFREGRGKMRDMRKAKKEIKQILTAEEFDAEAFEIAAEKMHAMFAEMGKKRVEVTKQLAMQLSKEDRETLADGFSKGFHGRGHNKGDKPRAFLKEFEKANDEAKRQRVEKGPELPSDMPPQP